MLLAQSFNSANNLIWQFLEHLKILYIFTIFSKILHILVCIPGSKRSPSEVVGDLFFSNTNIMRFSEVPGLSL